MREQTSTLKGGHGALCGIELKGGKASGEKFINNLNMFYHVANIGDARSFSNTPSINNSLSAIR